MFLKKRLKQSKFYKKLRKYYFSFYAKMVSEEDYIRNRFKRNLNRDLNLENPIYFNDKLQWLKLYWRDPLASQCADKYRVREIVQERIGEGYLNKLYGVYDSVDEIDIEELPKSFVLKGTHGSGFNIICKDKNKMDWEAEFRKMRQWLKKDYSLLNQEWVYKDIKPRIICEKYIEQGDGKELRDYRFFCFNGEVKFITVDLSITNKKRTRRNLYDLNWNLIDAEITYPNEKKIKVEKPEKLDEMIKISEKLSKDFPHARVDLYNIEGNILFGEITFFHQSGLGIVRPLDFEKKMGSWLHLPKKKV